MKNTFLERANSVIPRHCGIHSHCTAEYCKHKLIELSERKIHGLSSEIDDILSDVIFIINERHSKASRLKGTTMDISVK